MRRTYKEVCFDRQASGLFAILWRSWPCNPLAVMTGNAGSPFAGMGHRGPGLLRRQRLAFLQKLDGVLVGRAYERHHAVARRPVDGDAGLHEAVAERIDVVDLVGEGAEIARLAGV